MYTREGFSEAIKKASNWEEKFKQIEGVTPEETSLSAQDATLLYLMYMAKAQIEILELIAFQLNERGI